MVLTCTAGGDITTETDTAEAFSAALDAGKVKFPLRDSYCNAAVASDGALALLVEAHLVLRVTPRFQKLTSRLTPLLLPRSPRSSRLSGPQSLVRTSTHTTTWMQRLSLPRFSLSRLLLRLTVRSLLTSLAVLPQLPATGHALPVSSLTPTVRAWRNFCCS